MAEKRNHSKATGVVVGTAKAQRTAQLNQRLADAGTIDMSYLEGTIGYAVRRAQMSVFQDIYGVFGKLAITTVQFSVLAVVADNPGISQADLAQALSVERPRIVPILDALEGRNLVIRVVSPVDRRVRKVQLTSEGKELLRELKKRFSKHQANMLKRLKVETAEDILAQLWALVSPR